MFLVLDSDNLIFASHADAQLAVVLVAPDYAGKALVSAPDGFSAQPGAPAPEGAVVLRPAGGEYVPQSVTKLQFMRQCRALGVWAQAQAYLTATANEEVNDWWTCTTTIDRHNPMLLAAAAALGMDSAAIDGFFIAAVQLA